MFGNRRVLWFTAVFIVRRRPGSIASHTHVRQGPAPVCTGPRLRHNVQVSGELIDTTEMYLRTIFELEEEGTVPLRARIAERLGQSGPTVSQTVARMERDGLVVVSGDRHLELTTSGRTCAVSVMRKHRLAECLLVNVIGMPWEDVHAEACRWEHVISETVESASGTCSISPPPRRTEIRSRAWPNSARSPTSTSQGADACRDRLSGGVHSIRLLVRRIDEPLQTDHDVMSSLRRAGAVPGRLSGQPLARRAADGQWW